MKFSIIIPVYNVEQYLADCLDSLLAQDYTGNYEIICINDGSTDSSLAILKQYAEKQTNLVVIDTPNGGTAAARNVGIKYAKGEYLWFVDSDDWVQPDALQLLQQNLEKNQPDVLCFSGKLRYEETGKEEEDTGITEEGLSGWTYYNKYALVSRKFHFVCVVLRIYKREFIIQHNLLFEQGISHEDNLWVPQMCYYASSVDIIPNSLYVYRIRSGSKMQTPTIEKLLDIIKVANRLSDFFIPKTDIDKSVVYREIAGEYFSVFMPDKIDIYNQKYDTIKPIVNWRSYKTVSIYPRHRRIYHLLHFNVQLFHLYLRIEEILKPTH